MRHRKSPLPLLLLVCFATGARAQSAPAVAPPRLGGYVQVRETLVSPTGLTATLNRARLSADGTLPDRFSYRTLIEFQAGATTRTPASVSLREAIIRWTQGSLAFQGGQFKTPFSREYLIPVLALETPDFSAVVDSLAPKYDLGVMAEYVVPSFGIYAGAFNGEGQNAGLNRDSTVLFVARAALRPLAQVTVAGHAARGAPDSTRYGGDFTFEQSGLLLRAECAGQTTRGRPRDDFGWYLLAGFRPVASLQLLGKVEDFQRPSISRNRRASAYTLGANLERPGGRTRLLASFVSRKTGFPRVPRNSLIGQVQVRF